MNGEIRKVDSPEFEKVLAEIKQEFNDSIRPALEKRKDLVNRLGTAIEKYSRHSINRNDICKAIKQYLKYEIENELITEKSIERYCPEEWKDQDKIKAGSTGGRKTADNLSAKRSQVQINAISSVVKQKLEHAKPMVPEEAGLAGLDRLQNKDRVIATLEETNRQLEEALSQATPAATTASIEITTLQRRIDEQHRLFQSFERTAQVSIDGRIVSVVISVEPITQKVTVKLADSGQEC